MGPNVRWIRDSAPLSPSLPLTPGVESMSSPVAFRGLPGGDVHGLPWVTASLVLAALAAGTGLAVTTHALAVVGLALLGFLLLWAWRSPDAGLVGIFAVSFLLPFAVVPLDFGLKPTFLNLAVLLVYGRWLMRWIRGPQLQTLPAYTTGLVLIFGLLVGGAMLWGLNFARPSWFEWRKAGEYLLNLGLFVLVLQLIHHPSQIRLMVLTLAGLGTAGAVLGLLFYFLPRETAQSWLGSLVAFDYPAGEVALRYINDDPRGTLRAIGMAVDPNLLGAMSVLAACCLLPFVLGSRKMEVRLGAGTALLVLCAAIYLTYSRNALLAFCGVAAFLAIVRYRALIPLGLLGALLFLLLPQTQAYVQRLVEGLLRQDQATLMRLAEYRNAAHILAAYPWTGLGFFGTPSLEFAEGASSMVLLTVATTMGLPAMLLFLGLWGKPLLQFRQVHRQLRDQAMEPYALGLVAVVLALGLTGLFDHFYVNLLYPHMSALYWILLATCIQALRLWSQDSDTQSAAIHVERTERV